MKQKITMLGILILLCSITAMAQFSQSKPGDDYHDKIDKKNTPAAVNKSVKEQLFYEDFSDGGFANWTPMGEGIENWSEGNTSFAGGEAPEVMLYKAPLFEGKARFVSPVINTSGYTILNLNFLHYLNNSSDEYFYLRIETTSDGGVTWNDAWELYMNTTVNYGALENINVNTPDIGSEDFQFSFTFDGNSDDMFAWLIDNVSLGEVIYDDAMVVEISGIEGNYIEGDTVEVSSLIMNLGVDTASFDVQLEIFDDEGLVFESIKTVTDLSFAESVNVDFDPWISSPGYNITTTVTTLLDEDENPDNDTISYNYSVIHADYTYCLPAAIGMELIAITNFVFAGVENSESGFSHNGYGYFTNMQATVEIGEVYDLSIVANGQNVTVWFDLNQDFVFDTSEQVVYGLATAGGGELTTIEVTIPGYAMPGSTYMRVGAQYPSIGNADDPCAQGLYGEWEDYALEITGESMGNDAAVLSIDVLPIIEQGDITPMATVKNWGGEIITFPVTCNIDGTSYTSTIEVEDLGLGEAVQVEFDVWNAESGFYTFEVTANLDGDEVPENDTLTQDITIIESAPLKMVVGEEGTGTWCGWCVRGTVYMDSMKMKYPDNWIGIAVHNGDPMVVTEYDAGIGEYITGYPGGVVNREIVTDPSYFEAAYLTQMGQAAPAGIIVEDKVFNEATGELTFTLTSEFVAPVSNYRFNAVIVENEVTGTGEGWDQVNYYSGGAYGPMGGFEDLPNPVADMVYQDVARAILGGFQGEENSLPQTINAGETHSWEFTTSIDEEWDAQYIEVVGMLIDHTTGMIKNATKTHLIIDGVAELQTSKKVTVYPNPAQGQVTISNVEQGNIYIYNINGQLMMKKQNVSSVCTLDISDLETGIYFIKVFFSNQVITRKLVIE